MSDTPIRSSLSMDSVFSQLLAMDRANALILGLTASFVLLFLYRTIRDPLKSVPGPLLGRLTGFYITFLEFAGHRATTVAALHKRYGRVVRLAPDQLSFASPEALKDIYGANSKFTKGPIYESLGFKGVFTTREQSEYRVMKKRVVPSFNPASLNELEPIVHRQVGNLIKCFDKRVDMPLDVLPWFRMLALGVVGEGFAGESFGGLENEKTPQLLHDIDWVFPSLLAHWMFPWTSKLLYHSPIKGVRNFMRAAEEFNKYCMGSYKRYLTSFDPQTRHDLIARMVNERTALAKEGQSIPRHVTERGIVDELSNLVFAGTDTTGNTLTYLFYDLAHHPEWQTRLHKELVDALGEQASPDYNAIQALPVLEAVVQEIFRFRPASPDALMRVIPKGGAVVDNVYVPGGTLVSCQALSTQRDPNIFPEPDRFNPQRWLDAENTDSIEAMREQMLLFGKGARSCLGRRLATMEIKCALAAIARRYKVEIGSSTTDDDMEMIDHFVLIPKGQKCVLRLTRL